MSNGYAKPGENAYFEGVYVLGRVTVFVFLDEELEDASFVGLGDWGVWADDGLALVILESLWVGGLDD